MARIAWAVVTGSSAGSNGAFWLPFGATLVIGSESLNSTKNWQELRASFGGSLALSLDFIAEGPRVASVVYRVGALAEASHCHESRPCRHCARS